jgi:hypothetical protein
MSVSARLRFYSKLREQSFIVKHRGVFSSSDRGAEISERNCLPRSKRASLRHRSLGPIGLSPFSADFALLLLASLLSATLGSGHVRPRSRNVGAGGSDSHLPTREKLSK